MKDKYQVIINHSLEHSKVKTELHLIEEMAELTTELCKFNRSRESKIMEEMADVLFQIDKYLAARNMNIESLRKLSIIKSYELYPEVMNELQ